MRGSTVTDLWLTPRRTGVVVSARLLDNGQPDVAVSWTTGMVTTLKAADVLAGRYAVAS